MRVVSWYEVPRRPELPDVRPPSPLRIVTEAFGVVLFVFVAIAAVVAVVTLVGSGRRYEEIGRGGMSLDVPPSGPDPFVTRLVGQSPSAAVRDEEIRQLVQARSDRRVRRGEPPLDVDAEVARLASAGADGVGGGITGPAGTAAPTVDPALRAEIRDLVVARNARRVRAGKPPLDVDAEVERRIRELGGQA